ncbi:TetR/AcrR family transcriptional regulator [Paenibacillus nasutitermitis]|uniref:TetR/AcrR family transcriptional regulator n=1 Tax=Paenibacillus nasutitermitis TaxID=1652958 RepID=UPI0016636B6C|nr:TetR/AcrR family transcriptional regulator [Paenibacillus nasutitermitis]
MEGKKQQILEGAIKSFSEKGYRGTSIQDIADALGISKGSLYFYFKSKEDLLLSIFKYYIESMGKKSQELSQSTELSSRDKLRKQITMSYELYDQHKSFINIIMQERFDLNEELHGLILTLRANSLLATRIAIREQYGPDAEPYANDASILFNAFIEGYMGFVIMEGKRFDIERLASFILERMDQMIAGMIGSQADIMMETEVFEQWSCMAAKTADSGGKPDIHAELEVIRTIIDKSELSAEMASEMYASLQLLGEEIDKEKPQLVLIKGMLSLLKNSKIVELKKPVFKLEAIIGEMF